MSLTANLDLTLPLREAYDLVRCTVTEGLSSLTHVRAEIASRDDLPLASLIGQTVNLKASVGELPARKWTLIVGAARFARIQQSSLRYEIELHDPIWMLRHTCDTRKFRSLSAQEIITGVLEHHQIAHRWQITNTPAKRKYCVQYRESQHDFVRRLLEFEGIYFTHDDDGVLVLQDRSTAADNVDGKSTFALTERGGALESGEVGIFEFSRGRQVASGKYTVNDFNWKTPKVDLLKTATADEDAELELYDYQVGFRRPDQGEQLATRRLEAQRAKAQYVNGQSNVASFRPGRAFELQGAQLPGFSGEYLLAEVEHQFENRAFVEDGDTTGLTYENHFRGMPKDVPFRPEWTVPRPTIQGCHTAHVRGPAGEEIHTDRYGRFRAQFHWDRQAKQSDEDSRWVRALQETATSMTLARVGWEQTIAYIDGDPDRPIGIARNINGKMAPTYRQPKHQNMMTVKTPTYPMGKTATSPNGGGHNELRLDDTLGSMLFYLRSEKNMSNLVENDKTETVGHDETHHVTEMLSHTVEHDQTITIGNDSKTTVANNVRATVSKDRSKSVSGSETIEVSATLTESTVGDETETVGGSRKTSSGKDGRGSVNRMAEENIKRVIGGAYLVKAEGNTEVLCQENLVEEVGGDKQVTTKDGSIAQTISGSLDLTVTGAVFKTSGENMGVSATDTKVQIASNAAFNSDELVELRGNHITVEASGELKLKNQALEICLTPGAITVKGDVQLKADNTVTVTGKDDNLT